MNTIDSNAWSVLSDLLEMASEEFSNHSCNDFELPNTPENRALVEAMEMKHSPAYFKKKGLIISKDGTKIYTQDSSLMGYFSGLAYELSGKEE